MRVYLLRHGIAENGKPGSPDRTRALTAEGKRKLKEVLRTAKAAGVNPNLILTSPYVRAAETAEIAATVLGYKQDVLETSALVPDGKPTGVWDEVRTHKNMEELMLVGHQPLFGMLLSHLCNSPSLLVDFKKGAIACVEIERFGAQPHGVLRWFLTPKLAVD